MEAYKTHLGQIRASERKLDEIIAALVRENKELKTKLKEEEEKRRTLGVKHVLKYIELQEATEAQKADDDKLITSLYASLRCSEEDCRDLRDKHGLLEDRMGYVEGNQYAVVLIDGDGMMFHDSLIRKGREGGEEACKKLLQNARSTIRKTVSDLSPDLVIHVNIYASIEKLSSVIQACNDTDCFRSFTVGITRSSPFVSFIDVGEGKEMADSKIKDQLRWHYRNYNCKAIILGASHDNGYALPLSELRTSSVEQKPVALIEGPPFAKELQDLKSVKFFRWKDVFCDSQLSTRQASPRPRRASHIASDSGSAVVSDKQKLPGKTPSTVSEALVQVMALPYRTRLCFHYYLGGNCKFGDGCIYAHNYELLPLHLEALKELSESIGIPTPKSKKDGSNVGSKASYKADQHVKHKKQLKKVKKSELALDSLSMTEENTEILVGSRFSVLL